MRIRLALLLGLMGVLFLGACTPIHPDRDLPEEMHTPSQDELAATPSSPTYPRGWNQLLPFDGIKPIYDPQFVPASEAPLQDEELIMGVAWEGKAKAYPVTVLRTREMVNDEMAGVPYLVSW